MTENAMDSDGDGVTAQTGDIHDIHCLVFHEIGHYWDKEHGNWN